MKRKQFLATLGAGTLGVKALASPPAGASVSGTGAPVAPVESPPALRDFLCLDDFEEAARKGMDPAAFAFVAGGAADELTIQWNREKYRELRLRQRVLRDLEGLDCSTTLLGQVHRMPILVAPTANHRLVHPEGELATARGAGMAGATLVVSSGANTAVEDIAKVATQPLWFQLYMDRERERTRALVERAQDAGVKAICVTVDSPLDGPRYRQNRRPAVLPPGVGHPHYAGRKEAPVVVTLDEVRPALLEWRDIEWILSFARVPILLKGIMDPDDAETAVKLGVAGIIVSNHGGRCLDTQPATIEALPAVVRRVAGRVPVLVDGGIRRGTDVVKALALGASAVQVGRPCLYGLGVAGAEGVAHVLKLLRQELLLSMAVLGRRRIADIDSSVLWT